MSTGLCGLREQAARLTIWYEPSSPDNDGLNLILGDQFIKRRSANSERAAEGLHRPGEALRVFRLNV
jgi:hypothetical protein